MRTDQMNMTVYVKTIKGKTISVNCNKRQRTEKIKDEVERRTMIPRKHQCLVSQGKSPER